MKRKISAVLLGGTIVLFLLFPAVIGRGAKFGLTLWFHTVLPALLPFMVLSGFMLRQNITGCVSSVAYPVLARLFGLSRAGCYPAVIGFLSGYPVGAKTVAQMYREEMLSRQEAQYLLSFCNNASPMFLVEYIGVHCMGLRHPAVLFGIVLLSAWLGSFLSGRRAFYREERTWPGSFGGRQQSVIASLDESILDGFTTVTKIGGYIILFSILAQLASETLPVSALAKYIGIGILEITTGGAVLSGFAMPVWLKGVLLSGLCAFGGLSSAAQTASVLSGTGLSMGAYLLAKLRQSVIAAGLAFLWFRLAG